MYSKKVDPHTFLIDLKPTGFNNFIASYVLLAQRAAIVETGPTATVPHLLGGLTEIGLNTEDVDYVAVSHIHLDHGGGAGLLLRSLPRAKLIVHERGAPHIISPRKLWAQSKQVLGKVAELYGEPIPVDKERVIIAEDGMTFDLGEGVELRVVQTAGHASHHQSFFEKKSQGVFPGDAAGIYIPEFDVIIPTTPPPFHLEKALASIEKLKQLEPKVLYYSHFGRAINALEKLQRHADQLRLWASIVAEEIKEQATLEEIKDEITKRDLAVSKVADYIKAHPILDRGTISQDIEGFIEYFKYLEGQR